jgi:hypothetical protein
MVRPIVPDTVKKIRDRLPVAFITERVRVEGEIHVRPGERLTDFMNAADNQFIAVTHAKVYNLSEGEKAYSVDFLNMNKSRIIVGFPMSASGQQAEATVI